MKKKSLAFFFLCALLVALRPAVAQGLSYDIQGVHGPALNQIHQALASKEKMTGAEAIPIIKKTLQPYGYFQAQVQSQVQYDPQKHTSILHCWVDLGPQTTITRVDINILGPGRHEAIPIPKALSVGQPLISTDYQQAKNQLLNALIQWGYLDAQLTKKQVLIHKAQASAHIVLDIDTGKKYFLGPVSFATTVFDPKFLARFVPFKPGDLYRNTILTQFQQSLVDSGFFDNVEVIPDRTRQQQQVPIHVNVTPRKARQYLLGLGYGTDTGVRGLMGLQLRQLTPTGQQLNTLLNASQRRMNLSVKYLIPGRKPMSDRYLIKGYIEQENEPFPGRSRSIEVSASHVAQLGLWKQTLSLNLLYDRSRTDNESITNTLLYPSLNWLYLRNNDGIYINKGLRFYWGIQGAAKYLASSTPFIQTQLQYKSIHSPTPNTRVLLRGSLGYTRVHDIHSLPLSLQFYVGGTHSIRGYSYKSIGPGKQQVTASIELQRRVYQHLYITGFCDAGNAQDSGLFHHLNHSVGLGFSFLSPLGAIEITTAKAMNQGHQFLVQFTMGPEL